MLAIKGNSAYEGLTGEIEGTEGLTEPAQQLTFKVNGGIDVSADQFSVTNIQNAVGRHQYDLCTSPQGILVGKPPPCSISRWGLHISIRAWLPSALITKGITWPSTCKTSPLAPIRVCLDSGRLHCRASSKVAANDIAAIQQIFPKKSARFSQPQASPASTSLGRNASSTRALTLFSQ